MFLYADDYGVERKLKTVNSLAKAAKDPVIKMTFVQLDITDHKIVHGDQTIQVTSQDDTDAFHVKDIQIIQEEQLLIPPHRSPEPTHRDNPRCDP